MPIQRTGACPIFLEYVTRRALIPHTTTPTPEFQQLTQYGFDWMDIPSYQRGLVWDDEKLEELLGSRSRFLGNAILGQFPIPPTRQDGFSRVPSGVDVYDLLIDGLQRFSIGTACLSILHTLVLAHNPTHAAAAPLFKPLRTHAATFAPVYQQNDTELQNHPRQAVRDSYNAFRNMLGNWLTRELENDPADIAKKLQHLFLERQIAPDTYHGFTSSAEIANTFIGLNTVRVQLNIVDWLRSIIIEQGSRHGWNQGDVEDIENQFSQIFLEARGTAPERDLMPFAAITKDTLVEQPNRAAIHIFPSWETGLQVSEVKAFLEFVAAIFESHRNPFFHEIRQCGAIPLAACICFYYRQFLSTGIMPSFISGGSSEDDELHAFLRATYRVLFDGRIGRTRSFAENLIRIKTPDLIAAANAISQSFLGHDLATAVDSDWLSASLRKGDARRSMRVFNACFLPAHGQPLSFAPQNYGPKAQDYQIDHLIPKSALMKNQPGEADVNMLPNFAPIRRTANNRQSNIACSSKLVTGGNFEAEVATDPDVHPYVRWLVTNQARYGNQLDRQELLLPNATPSWSQERINWLSDHLLTRL